MDQSVNLTKMIDTIIHQLSKCYGFHLKFSERFQLIVFTLKFVVCSKFKTYPSHSAYDRVSNPLCANVYDKNHPI